MHGFLGIWFSGCPATGSTVRLAARGKEAPGQWVPCWSTAARRCWSSRLPKKGEPPRPRIYWLAAAVTAAAPLALRPRCGSLATRPGQPRPRQQRMMASQPPPTGGTAQLSEPVTSGAYTITKVVDGDTLSVQRDGVVELRLIGIDTHENHDPRKPVQCFGEAARSRRFGKRRLFRAR